MLIEFAVPVKSFVNCICESTTSTVYIASNFPFS